MMIRAHDGTLRYNSWDFQVNNQGAWENSTQAFDPWGLYAREARSPRRGEVRRKRATDGNGYEENWIGRTGVSPFKITKKVDKVSPKLVACTLHPHNDAASEQG
jgi:type VI protein secretion system component Hcp